MARRWFELLLRRPRRCFLELGSFINALFFFCPFSWPLLHPLKPCQARPVTPSGNRGVPTMDGEEEGGRGDWRTLSHTHRPVGLVLRSHTQHLPETNQNSSGPGRGGEATSTLAMQCTHPCQDHHVLVLAPGLGRSSILRRGRRSLASDRDA